MNNIPETVNLNSWKDVDQYLSASTVHISFDYLERASQREYPRDAFSKGQLVSKLWLLEKLYEHNKNWEDPHTIAILGCWIGSMVDFLQKSFRINRVYGFDVDPASIELAEKFNAHYVQDNWKFKGVVADVNMLETSYMVFETGGELIEVTPSIVINTSCEHMGTEWFETAGASQLIIMQTNDSPQYEGHINTCGSIKEMQDKYPLTNTLYAGEMITPAYTRYMQIGYK